MKSWEEVLANITDDELVELMMSEEKKVRRREKIDKLLGIEDDL